jgi:hypothetical protein
MRSAKKRDNNVVLDPVKQRAFSPWYWAYENKIQLQAGEYVHEGHEYLGAPLTCYDPFQVTKKGAQMGFTEASVLKSVHGMIHHRFPAGVLHLFPTSDDVQDFSRARFNTLIDNNPETIGRFVRNTDAVNIKQVQSAMLYLRGAKSTRQIEGLRKTSSKLKSIPVDRIVFDERDEMDQAMIDMALERVSHSSVKEIEELSTPTVPDYGIDRAYALSDQRVWMIKCDGCGRSHCLEVEFPKCLARGLDGKVRRVCVHCGHEVYPYDGAWVAMAPGSGKATGWWVSQLNSAYVDPGEILRLFESLGQPGIMSKQEFYNSKLAQAYVEAENRLTRRDLERCLTMDAMASSHDGPTAMGVDVGTWLHVVIGCRPNEATRRIIHLCRVKEWNELHNLAIRFNVSCCVIDGEPERHKVREFKAAEPYSIFLSDYQEGSRGAPRWDLEAGTVVGNRTEILDRTHALITGRTMSNAKIFELPHLSSEVEQFIQEATAMVKVLVVDGNGQQKYTYKQLGPDHYRHALAYFDLACERISWIPDRFNRRESYAEDYNPLTYQIDRARGGRDNYANNYDPLGGIR